MNAGPKPSQSSVRRPFLWTLLVRCLMLAVFAGSAALVWWSLDRLPPIEREVRRKDAERADLAGEIQKFEMNWDARAAEKLDTEYQLARERLFTGAEEQEQWSEELKRQAQILAFDTAVRNEPAQAHPHKAHKLTVTPAILELQPSRLGQGVTNSPYERLLTLTANLEKSKRRVDLMELFITSDSNSVHQTKAVLQLWAEEKDR